MPERHAGRQEWYTRQDFGRVIAEATDFLGADFALFNEIVAKGRDFQQRPEFRESRIQAQYLLDLFYEVATDLIRYQQETWQPVEGLAELTHLAEMLEVVADGEGFFTRIKQVESADLTGNAAVKIKNGVRLQSYLLLRQQFTFRTLRSEGTRGRDADFISREVGDGYALTLALELSPELAERGNPGWTCGINDRKSWEVAQRRATAKRADERHKDHHGWASGLPDDPLLPLHTSSVRKQRVGDAWGHLTAVTTAEGLMREKFAALLEAPDVRIFTYAGRSRRNRASLENMYMPPGLDISRGVSGQIAGAQNALVQSVTTLLRAPQPRSFLPLLPSEKPEDVRGQYSRDLYLTNENVSRYLFQLDGRPTNRTVGESIEQRIKHVEIRIGVKWLNSQQLIIAQSNGRDVLVEEGSLLYLHFGRRGNKLPVRIVGLEKRKCGDLTKNHAVAAGFKDEQILQTALRMCYPGRGVNDETEAALIYFDVLEQREGER